MNKIIETESLSAPKNLNVEDAVDDLQQAVDGLSEVIESLKSRMAPLLKPSPPEGENCERTGNGDSEVAKRIISSADRIRASGKHILDLIDHL